MGEMLRVTWSVGVQHTNQGRLGHEKKNSDEDKASKDICLIEQAIETLSKKEESGNDVLRKIKVQNERQNDVENDYRVLQLLYKE